MCSVFTNKHKEDTCTLEANTRRVTPGGVGLHGDIYVEDGGFRTDAPICPQLAVSRPTLAYRPAKTPHGVN